jgi:methionyl aminopeptidase
MRSIGSIVARTLRTVARRLRSGITPGELNEIGARVLHENGARSAPPMIYGYPGDICISVNDQAMHAIPGARVILPGDLVKLDLVAEKDGFFADAAVSVNVPPVSRRALSLVNCAERAFGRALSAAQAGNRVREIGRAVEPEVRRSGFSVIRSSAGTAWAVRFTKNPWCPIMRTTARAKLTEGLVITIEPVVFAGTGRAHLAEDGWTFYTDDGSLAAHYEHTVVITRGRPVLLTAA